MPVQTIRDLPRLRMARAALSGRVAFVPTMGALHAGHMKLVAAAKLQAEHVIASIFVNPAQFGPNEDLSRYPRREAEDAGMLADAGVAILWAPGVETMYPDDFTTKIMVLGVSEGLCGATRPGHFDGVATVVAKLFGQVRPDVALFGEKDWQQLQVVRRMTADLDMAVEIIGVPTEREADGLAMSSRNIYLTPDQRSAAVALPIALTDAAAAIAGGADEEAALAAASITLREAGFAIDYIERRDDRLLAAARIGTTRLIDNVPITPPH
jgi:pantoate--beta-alanine ligase